MSGLIYLRYELRRSFRNRRLIFFSLGFPLLLFLLVAGAQRHNNDLGGSGIPADLYYMVSYASFGTMMAMVSSGTRIAFERQIGWTRQLRITPLSTRAYFRAKVFVGYTMATLTVLLLYVAGASFGVSMSAHRWVEMTFLILIALLPFAALGITLGHLVNVDSLGPATGGIVALLSILGGTFFPLSAHGFLHDLGECLPSYWLVQAGRVALTGQSWEAKGWIVIAAWTVALTFTARWAFQRAGTKV
jgi:ABC-2 type transport system permease protein